MTAKALHRRLDGAFAARVRALLEDEFGGYYAGFEDYLTSDCPWHEWRFGGSLGTGGKLHFNARKLYVGCYPEDRTAVNDGLIDSVNTRLEAMLRGL